MSERRDFQDRELTCVDCGGKFTWSADVQAFYKEKGFSEPKRCSNCKQAQKEKRASADTERLDKR